MKTKRKWIGPGVLCVAIASAEASEAYRAFMQAMSASMTRMEREMKAAPMDGNVDHDFAIMMIPHHQGAIDMAKAELSYGSNPVMRRLAQEIIVDQQSEIEAMNLQLKKTGSSTTKEK